MRMIMPGLRNRRTVDRLLTGFFREYRLADFQRAICALSRFYNLRTPRVDWFEYLDWGKTAGRTYENGEIHLVHPENWKNGRKYKSERQWVNTVYHEMGHYVLWADAERKADGFAYRFVRGISANGRNGNGAAHFGNGESRPRRKGPVARRRRPRRRRPRSRSR
jgi:hypothetical protein